VKKATSTNNCTTMSPRSWSQVPAKCIGAGTSGTHLKSCILLNTSLHYTTASSELDHIKFTGCYEFDSSMGVVMQPIRTKRAIPM